MFSVKVTKILDIDSKNLYNLGMSQLWPYANFKYDIINLGKILSTADKSDTGYVLENHFQNQDEAKKYQ